MTSQLQSNREPTGLAPLPTGLVPLRTRASDVVVVVMIVRRTRVTVRNARIGAEDE